MATPLKTPKINYGVNSTTMEDLDDHMLTQILFRLPNSKTVVACSPVNKRWCSLISDPNFPVQFVNHKKKTTTLLNDGLGFDHEYDEPPWTFVTTIVHRFIQFQYYRKLDKKTKFIFQSPLSLKFLPGNSFTTLATFKDLVLCSYETYKKGGRIYYITNPLTKQWVALPPYPVDKHQLTPTTTTLICQPPYYNHNQDYKFRIVEVCDPPIVHSQEPSEMDNDFFDMPTTLLYTFKLVVYCSEIGEWKVIDLRIPKEVGPFPVSKPAIVVSNGIIYFKSELRLVALDPFDVNDACNTTLEALVMPPLPDFGYLLESSRQLLVVHTPNSQGGLSYRKDGTTICIELEMVVWKLEPNQAPLVWEMTFQGLCTGTLDSIGTPRYFRSEGRIYATHIGVHPYNDKLIYMYLELKGQFILCDTQIGSITPIQSLPHNHNVSTFHRLEQQWWPTPVPALVQCVTAT
ncbi:F-box protein At5g07610-like [Silene latifolia]|uniref:F-box protein At5g07610-like n=1 Tax=Silene latifolia TaxID=37657 RepID=UPI003D783A25